MKAAKNWIKMLAAGCMLCMLLMGHCCAEDTGIVTSSEIVLSGKIGSYEMIRAFSQRLAAYCDDGKWGFLNVVGKPEIEAAWDEVGDFHDGAAWVREKNRYGYIRRDGSYLINPVLNEAHDFSEGLALAEWDGKYAYFDTTGRRVITMDWEEAHSFSDGFARGYRLDAQNGERVCEYINQNGEVVISVSEGEDFSDGLAAVRIDGLYGYMNTQGKIEIEPRFVWAQPFSEGLAFAAEKGRIICIDKKGETNYKLANGYTTRVGGYDAEFVLGKYREGVVNVTVETVPMSYSHDVFLLIDRNGRVRASHDSMTGVRNVADASSGLIRYQQQVNIVKRNGRRVQYENCWGFMNTQGEIVQEAMLGKATDVVDGLGFYDQVDDTFTLKWCMITTREGRYLQAKHYYEEKEYGAALQLLDALGSYKDAPQWKQEIHYEIGLQYLERGYEDIALTEFENAGNTRDAKDIVGSIYYARAEKSLESGDIDGASALFEKAGDYLDAAQRRSAIYYDEAMKCLEEGDERKAARLLESAGDYLDARTLKEQLDKQNSIIKPDDPRAAVLKMRSSAQPDALERAYMMQYELLMDIGKIAADNYIITITKDGKAQATTTIMEIVRDSYEYDKDYCDNEATMVSGWSDLKAVAAGETFLMGLTNAGTVEVTSVIGYWADVSDFTDILAVDGGSGHIVGLKKDGTVVAVGNTTNRSQKACAVENWSDIVMVTAGECYSIGLKADGTVLSTGRNEDGCREVQDWKGIISVSAGKNHTVGLREDGTVIAVGNNKYGQCDVESWRDIVAVSAGEKHTVGLKADGTLVAAGDNRYGQCDVTEWKNVLCVDAGSRVTVAVMKDGKVIGTSRAKTTWLKHDVPTPTEEARGEHLE